jgi:hypothetical protein
MIFLRIVIQPEEARFFSIQPDSNLTIDIYHLLIEKLYCQITEIISKPTDRMGFIKAKLPINRSLNYVVDYLHGYFGGYISQLGDTFEITDFLDDSLKK